MSDITEGLQALMDRGFRFTHARDSDGEILAVVGIRVHHEVIDLVQLYGEDDADAMRIPADEPDILFPSTVLHRISGRAAEVVESVLALPDPLPQDTSVGPKGCWVPTAPGRARWLPATGSALAEPVSLAS
ncbi:hypothetical protein GCM10012275_26840 [Longimycelium tulufanense]|uniref:Uncharacterized protein n=1 Tax=Longimycelium tulufanense TaxID=907463 RepID=A0A8J3FU18_9PSEU|nr:hypothetical protein [Longimycelium tulufanense]GGM54335.1 hypothetical protein GCM10012275_26840 [Longimycelium tulufanense]